MAYTVTWKALPGKAVISTEVYNDLSEAMTQAKVVVEGPRPVEITVTDDKGEQYYLGVSD